MFVCACILSLVSIWSPRSHGSPRLLETVYRRSKRLYGNSDGKLRDDRGDRDDRDRPDRTLLYPGDRDDRVKFTCDHMETVNRRDRLHTISSDRGHWGDRGDYMETRLKRRKLENAKFGFTNWMISFFVFIDSGTISDQRKKKTAW